MNTPSCLNRFIFLGVIGLPLVSRAALTWETSQLQLTAMTGTTEIATSFSFRNNGDTPVTITALRTSCDCTTAEIDKPDYAPGESGRIEVRFHPRERTGVVERTITVTTTDQSTSTMSLRVNIFEPVSCTPQILTWEKGTPLAGQTVEITSNSSSPIKTIDLGSNDLKKFTRVHLEPIEPARRYRLSILPLDAHEPRETPLHCQIEFTDGSIRRLVISTVIK